MLVKLLCFLGGMIVMWILTYLLSVGHAINILKQTQQSCAAMFVASEQGLQEVLHLKYLAMEEAKRSQQNITSQKYIDQLNITSVKQSVMRNYVACFPGAFDHLMEYGTWEELEEYVNKFVQRNKESE